jgi:hypothetical protein
LLRTNWLQQLFMICCRLLSLSINWCRDRKRDRRLLLWFLNILRFLCNWFLNYWLDAVMNQCWFLLASRGRNQQQQPSTCHLRRQDCAEIGLQRIQFQTCFGEAPWKEQSGYQQVESMIGFTN